MRPEEMRSVTLSTISRVIVAILLLVLGIVFQRTMFDLGLPFVTAIATFVSAAFILLSVVATASYVFFEKHRRATDAYRPDGGVPLVSETPGFQGFIIREFT